MEAIAPGPAGGTGSPGSGSSGASGSTGGSGSGGSAPAGLPVPAPPVSPSAPTTKPDGAPAHVDGLPDDYLSWYEEASTTCPGLSWTVLAGIGTMESDNGQTSLPGVHSGANFAGAEGPMQFEPATFAYYGMVAPGGASPPSPYDPPDAIWSAARMLCADGAGSASALYGAIFDYNHSATYVSDVLALAAQYSETGGSTVEVSDIGLGSVIVRDAESYIGTPYVWGGESPTTGFDCSGLVQWVYAQAGLSLPRVAQDQYDAGPHLPTGAQLYPGDLIFFGSGPSGVEHVGIYIGNGQMVDAPYTGADVRIDSINQVDPPFVGATRPEIPDISSNGPGLPVASTPYTPSGQSALQGTADDPAPGRAAGAGHPTGTFPPGQYGGHHGHHFTGPGGSTWPTSDSDPTWVSSSTGPTWNPATTYPTWTTSTTDPSDSTVSTSTTVWQPQPTPLRHRRSRYGYPSTSTSSSAPSPPNRWSPTTSTTTSTTTSSTTSSSTSSTTSSSTSTTADPTTSTSTSASSTSSTYPGSAYRHPFNGPQSTTTTTYQPTTTTTDGSSPTTDDSSGTSSTTAPLSVPSSTTSSTIPGGPPISSGTCAISASTTTSSSSTTYGLGQSSCHHPRGYSPGGGHH